MGDVLSKEALLHQLLRRPLIVFFLLVLFAHMGLLYQRLNFERLHSDAGVPERPLKVRLLEDKKQIVQSEDSQKREPREDAFLSDKDRSFDRQTRARVVDKFKEASKGGGEGKKKPQDVKLSDLGAYPKSSDPYKNEAGPRPQVSSTNDHVEEVPLGDLTELNTAEYKYYGFYHRIREKLEQFWGASIQEKAQALAGQGRQLASDDEHITSLQVTLNGEGKVIGIRILGTSGVRELDSAAVEAFNEAGPFPNPPKGLVKNGRVTIEWGFVVQT